MKKTPFTFGLIGDPIEKFDTAHETSFFILAELTRRGHRAYYTQPKNLALEDGVLNATAQEVLVLRKAGKFEYKLKPQVQLDFRKLDALWLRKDPPVDLAYYDHLTLIEAHLQKHSLFCINDPSGIKRMNEKIYPDYFAVPTPKTVITSDRDTINRFLKKNGKCVLKPLNSSGGRGILILDPKDKNLGSLLEVATVGFTQYVVIQKFLPGVIKGDKRILLWNGKTLGSFLRVPVKSDFRGNLHSGGRLVRAGMTAAEKKLVSELGPKFVAEGLYFVGLDLIDGQVTEINTTSPMGLGEINRSLGKGSIEREFIDGVEGLLTEFLNKKQK